MKAKRKDREASSAPIVDIPTSIDKTDKNPAAVALGKLGGKKGGPARAAKLSAEERTAIAKKGAYARWGKTKPS